ncbi:MAG: hypothetical protein CR982_08745 [Candidatus Cloacimonadota bacterium]|nr:MAG: hypothetical protein CR982_08745 [Candidatus Cloacimonadota bacterium]PIE77721.1 MAG: hypothetical protein CSA15_11400 [Candidatus Delongbacteria bacterium]
MGALNLLDSLKKFLPNNTSNKLLKSDFLYIERGCVAYIRFKGIYEIFKNLMNEDNFEEKFQSILNMILDRFIKKAYAHGGVIFKFDTEFISLFFDKSLMNKEDNEIFLSASKCVLDLEEEYKRIYEELNSKYGWNIKPFFTAGLKLGNFIDLIIGSDKRKDRVLVGPNAKLAVELSFTLKNGGIAISPEDNKAFKTYLQSNKRGDAYVLKGLKADVEEFRLPLDDYLNLKTSIMKSFIPVILFKKLKKDPSDQFLDYKKGYVINLELFGLHKKAEDFLREYPQIDDDSEKKIYLDEFYFGINKLFKKISKLITNYDGSINKVGLSKYGLKILFTFSMPDDFENDSTNRDVCIEEITKIVSSFKNYKYKVVHFEDNLFGSIVGNSERSNYIVASPLMPLIENALDQIDDFCVVEIHEGKNVKDCIKGEALSKVVKGIESSNKELKAIPKKISLSGLHNHKVIGRNKEIITLNKLFREGGKIVTVAGEYGSGKTRLVEEIIKRMENENFSVVQAKVENRDNIIDLFKLIIEEYSGVNLIDSRETIEKKLNSYFSDLIKDCPEDFEKRLFSEKLFILYKIFYNIDIDGSPYKILSPRLRLENLKEALSLFIIMCYYRFNQDKKGVVFIFDDIDNLKHEEKELLQYVIQYSISHLVEKGNRRNKKGGVNKISFMVTHHINSELNFNIFLKPIRIDLSPLKKDTMRLLLKEVVSGKKLPSEIEKVIFKRSEGNPFYLEQYFRFIFESGFIREKDSELEKTRSYRKKDIHEDIKDIVRTNLSKIEPKLLKILQAAAITGVKFDSNLIKEYYPDYSYDDFKKVSNYSYIKKYFNQEDWYVFSHPIISDVLYDMMDLEERKKLHNNIGELLEKMGKINQILHSNWMGYHFFCGDNKEKALKYLEIAYNDAREKHFIEASFRNLESYLNFFDEGLEKDKLMLEKVVLLYEMGENSKAEDIANSLVEKYRESNNISFLIDTLLVVLKFTFETAPKKRIKDIVDLLGKDIETLDDSDFRRAKYYKYCGKLLQKDGKFKESIKVIEKGIKSSKTSSKEFYCEMINFLAETYEKLYDFKKGIKLLEDNIENTKNIKSLKYQSIFLGNLGKLYYKEGQVKKSIKYYNEALEITSTLSLKRIEGMLAAQLANIYLEIRDLAKSQINLERSLKIYRALSDIKESSYRLSDYGELFLCQNNLIEAEKCFNRAQKSAKEIDSSTARAYALTNFGRLNSFKRNYIEAENYFKEAINIFKEKKLYKRMSMVYFYFAEMYHKKIEYHLDQNSTIVSSKFDSSSDDEILIEELEKAYNYGKTSKNINIIGRITLLFGKTYNRVGEYDKAIDRLKKGIKFLEISDFSRIYTNLIIELSKSYLAKGNIKKSRDIINGGLKVAEGRDDNRSIMELEAVLDDLRE